MPPLAKVVPADTCTEATTPGAISPIAHSSIGPGAIPQVPGPLKAETLQFTPAPGSGSLRFTPVAVPVPAADEFATVTVKPIGDPPLTLALSAVTVIDSAGALGGSPAAVPDARNNAKTRAKA